MSQWDRLPSGSKRRSDFADPERPGYRLSFPQRSPTSQSPEASTSPHSSQEGQTPRVAGQLPFLTAGREISSDVVGTRIDEPFHALSSTMMLPTPRLTSSAEFTLPPIALSSPRSAPYTHYSGNVPHKPGTDHLTTQTLQRENSDLASAYAQAQTYIADLNTKVQASQAENGRLTKERQRLMGKIEFLEAQLEELEHSMQQTQKHTAAKDAQYSHIMELSTRLQSRGAAEQHEWSCEKKSMQGIIDSLNHEITCLRKSYAGNTKVTKLTPSLINDRPNSLEGDSVLATQSLSYGLLTEMEALRRTNTRMEVALAGVRGDNAQLAECIEKLGGVEKNIHQRVREAETARGLVGIVDGIGDSAKERELAMME